MKMATNNNIKRTNRGIRVNNKGITNICMVRITQLVFNLNSVVSIHTIKFREVGGINILKFKWDDKKC